MISSKTTNAIPIEIILGTHLLIHFTVWIIAFSTLLKVDVFVFTASILWFYRPTPAVEPLGRLGRLGRVITTNHCTWIHDFG
jgi:hypothetical protein